MNKSKLNLIFLNLERWHLATPPKLWRTSVNRAIESPHGASIVADNEVT